MSAVKQEVAAILMDYTDQIPEQVYIDILNKLGKIPDHKDPRKAAEIQRELEEANENLSILEDERELLIEEAQGEKALRQDWENVGRSLAFLCEKIFNKKPIFDGTKVIYDISSMDEVDRNINKVNAFLNNLDAWNNNHNTVVDESFIVSGEFNDASESLDRSTWEGFRDLMQERRNSLYLSEDEEKSELENSDMEYDEDQDIDDVNTIPVIATTYDSNFISHNEEKICGFYQSYLLSEINYVFDGNLHNYYGAMLLHGENCWSKQIESINRFKIHHTKKKIMREMKYQTFQNKKSQWHHNNNTNNVANISLTRG